VGNRFVSIASLGSASKVAAPETSFPPPAETGAPDDENVARCTTAIPDSAYPTQRSPGVLPDEIPFASLDQGRLRPSRLGAGSLMPSESPSQLAVGQCY
jgi:hypothetical protein